MKNRTKALGLLSAALMIAVLALSGCGGGSPAAPSGGTQPMAISGTVSAPGGQMAYYQPSVLQQIADLIMTPVSALTGTAPVGAGVSVSLKKIDNTGAPLATQPTGLPVTATTNANGSYTLNLPAGMGPSSDLALFVGAGATQLRAILSSTTAVDVNPVTEVTVQLVADGTHTLANFTPAEVETIKNDIASATATVTGSTIANIVANANAAAQVDPNVTSSVNNAQATAPNWTLRVANAVNGGFLDEVAEGSGAARFVAVGNNGAIMTSADGVSWVTRTSGTTAHLRSVAWNGTTYVAGDWGSAILTSPDGISWTVHNGVMPRGNGIYGIAWSPTLNKFVGVGGFGLIMTSPDGVTWAQQTSGTANTFWNVIWGGNQFVATGSSGTIATSPDGVTWTIRTTGVTAALGYIVWNGAKYVAAINSNVSAGTFTLSSTDGINWVQNTAPADLQGICWSGTQFVAVTFGGGTFGGRIYTSTDGLNWSEDASPSTKTLTSVIYSTALSKYIAVGYDIITSP